MIGNLFRLLGMLDEILAVIASVTATVEALGQVAGATGEQKRAAATARLREHLRDLDLPLPDRVIGAMIDGVVWVANTVLPRWTEQTNGAVLSDALEASARMDGRTPEDDDPDLRREDLEERARAEFDRLEAKNAGVKPPGRKGGRSDGKETPE